MNIHEPVMCEEIVTYLKPKPGETVLDCTVGTGGHASLFLQRISPGGTLVGLDRDQESLAVAKERLQAYGSACHLIHSDFRHLDRILAGLGIAGIDIAFFDLGLSSYQLDDPQRGFSFQEKGPLDMRMDRNGQISAYDLVNNLGQEELEDLFWKYGQERFSQRISRLLVRTRRDFPISTTQDLARLVVKALPRSYSFHRIHPATRVFQALRIAVNQELDALQETLAKAASFLKSAGRMGIISFHSLEDRIVKIHFRQLACRGSYRIVTAKPLRPTWEEVKANPRSRSARLRVIERMG